MFLDHKVDLPAALTHRQQIAVIAPVEEFVTLVFPFALQEVELVIAIKVNLVGDGLRDAFDPKMKR